MDTVKLELGIIGDFLTGSFGARLSPLKGEDGQGLKPEHFSDPSARAAFELIAAADLQDSATSLTRSQEKCTFTADENWCYPCQKERTAQMATTYGYARVSSADQNEARQIVALTDAGIDFRENACGACNPK